jgi:hypothetical protein
MTEFRPRMGSYIKKRNGKFYYRRAIPKQFRHLNNGKTEWNILLDGKTVSDRVSEAHAYAHQHNREIEFGIGVRMLPKIEISETPDGPDESIRLDFAKMPLPDGRVPPPFKAYRDGKVVEIHKIAYSRDPDFLREAERDGFFPMSYDEGHAQLELYWLVHGAKTAKNADRKEIAELKAEKVRAKIDGLTVQRGETILSTLPKWHRREEPRHTTKAAHKRRVQEFVNLHGNMPLASITKRHVVEFVEHIQKLRHRGKPMAATSISNYLARIIHEAA